LTKVCTLGHIGWFNRKLLSSDAGNSLFNLALSKRILPPKCASIQTANALAVNLAPYPAGVLPLATADIAICTVSSL